MNQTIPYSFNKMAVYKQPSIPEPIIALDTIPAISWDFENASTSAVNFSNYVTYDGSSTLNYAITETLPVGVSLNNSTLSADKSLMTGDVDTTLTLNVSASDVLSTATEQFDLEIVNVVEPVPPQPEPNSVPLTFENIGNAGRLTIKYNFSNGMYSKNDGEWTSSSDGVTIDPGEKVAISSNYWQNNRWNGTKPFTYTNTGDPQYKVYGNLMSVYNWQDTPPTFGFLYAFGYNRSNGYCRVCDAAGLILPPNVSEGCYVCMFEANNYLTAAPSALPALTLVGGDAGYQGCYQAMFKGCQYLLVGPSIIAATSVSGTNTQACDQMFRECKRLSTGIQLFVTDIVGKKCFCYMFPNCNNLPWVKVHFTTWDTNSTNGENGNNNNYGWLYNAGTSVTNPTFYYPSSLTIPSRGSLTVPQNWDVVNINE